MGLYKRGDIWWYNFVHDGEHIQKSSRMADQAEQLTDNPIILGNLPRPLPLAEGNLPKLSASSTGGCNTI